MSNVWITTTPTAELKKRETQYVAKFDVYHDGDGGLRGQLIVSKGGIDWRPANAREPIQSSWDEFAKWMEGG